MDIESLISTYGYLAIAIGTFLEGETALVAGGFASQRGLLALQWVILVAFTCTLLADQFFFHLGRWKGSALLNRRETWRARGEKVREHIHRHQVLLIFGYRYLYGLRTITPFVMGMSGVSSWRFLLFDAMGVAIWASAIGTLGYFFGRALEGVIGDIHEYQGWFIGGIAGFALLVLVFRRWRMREVAKKAGAD